MQASLAPVWILVAQLSLCVPLHLRVQEAKWCNERQLRGTVGRPQALQQLFG